MKRQIDLNLKSVEEVREGIEYIHILRGDSNSFKDIVIITIRGGGRKVDYYCNKAISTWGT